MAPPPEIPTAPKQGNMKHGSTIYKEYNLQDLQSKEFVFCV